MLWKKEADLPKVTQVAEAGYFLSPYSINLSTCSGSVAPPRGTAAEPGDGGGVFAVRT